MTTNYYMLEPEVAEFLRISVRTLQRWRLEGCGPLFRRHGGRVTYQRDDVIAWSQTTAAHSTAEADNVAAA